MTYLSYEFLLYLIIAAVSGAIFGWLIRRSKSSREIADLQTRLEYSQKDLGDITTKFNAYKNDSAKLQATYDSRSNELAQMNLHLREMVTQAEQIPHYQTWVTKLQNQNNQTLLERDEFADLACQYVDFYEHANQKIKRLNTRVTDQETYIFRLSDMVTKVHRLNDKVTTCENDARGLYAMITQIQKKWRNEQLDAAHLRDLQLQMQEKINQTQAELVAHDKQYAEKFQQQQSKYKAETERLQRHINELKPLEGDTPGQDTTLNRFMDKIRLVGTSKNTVLGRAYKQLEETRRESSEKERIFVDTCEEKDAIINDLRAQVRTAENRAQAISAAAIQESKTKISELEKECALMNANMGMLREHAHTIEALKNKLAQYYAASQHQETPAKPVRTRAVKAKKPVPKPVVKLQAPAKNLRISAAKVKDDLQQVKGIGPVLEQKLNALGVHSFAQLGKLTRHSIAALDKTLGGIPGRIQRDGWANQSKKLYKKKYGKDL